MKNLSKWAWHPILFASYSVLALYASNLGETQFRSMVRPLVLSVIFSTITLGVFQILIKNWSRAGLMATWSLFLFLTYGHIYTLVKGLDWAAFLARHRVLLPVWALLFFVGVILLLKKVREPEKMTQILNIVMGALILFSLFTLGRHALAQSIAKRAYQDAETSQQVAGDLTLPENPPDIYYILLDGYTRADVLSSKFRFDNSDFIKSLEAKGFYVADCSRSNYSYTHLTLPSLMNMAYIDTLVGEIPPGATVDSLRFEDLTRDNKVMQGLESISYQTIAFENSYYWAQFSEADIYYRPFEGRFFSPNLTEFEELYLDTTMLSALRDWTVLNEIKIFKRAVTPNEAHAQRIFFTLDKLKDLPEMEGPQFIMAHLVIPHPPFIFNQDGLIPNVDAYNKSWEEGTLGQEGYLNNIRFINREILQVVDQILKESSVPPIIILQADHGSDFYDRTMILSAFYLPESTSQALYPQITPVNTFRWVFKSVFDASYDLLPDKTLSGKYPPFEFEPIPETYSHCLSNN